VETQIFWLQLVGGQWVEVEAFTGLTKTPFLVFVLLPKVLFLALTDFVVKFSSPRDDQEQH